MFPALFLSLSTSVSRRKCINSDNLVLFHSELGVHVDGFIATVGHTLIVGCSKVSCS